MLANSLCVVIASPICLRCRIINNRGNKISCEIANCFHKFFFFFIGINPNKYVINVVPNNVIQGTEVSEGIFDGSEEWGDGSGICCK